MQAGRTIIKRKITALGWFDGEENQKTGVIKVETYNEIKPGVEDMRYLRKTQYFLGAITITEDAHADACKIIETGKVISKDEAEEIIKANKERKKCQEQEQEA